MRVRTRNLVSAVAAAAIVVVGLLGAPTAAPAQAAEAGALPAAEFTAPLCEGATGHNPKAATGAVRDLTRIFGARLEAYNAGQPVMLYSVDGANSGSTPNCATRHVPGVGAVSSWVYCTDRADEPCSTTEADGSLSQQLYGKKHAVSHMQERPGNPTLTSAQSKLVRHLLSTDIPLKQPLPTDLASYPTAASVASDATDAAREARQWLIWCITDRSILPSPPYFPVDTPAWCDANFGAADQAAILAQTPDSPQIRLDPEAADATVGSTASVTLATNLFNQPLQVQAESGAVSVCAGDETGAMLDASGMLTIPGNDSTVTANVSLCLTRAEEGAAAVTASARPAAAKAMLWSESVAPDGAFDCQIYATPSSAPAPLISSSATVAFHTETPGGGDGGDGDGGPGGGGDGDGGGSTDPGDPDRPAGDDGTGEAPGQGDSASSLPATGGQLAPFVIPAAVVLVIAGTIVTIVARRRSGGRRKP